MEDIAPAFFFSKPTVGEGTQMDWPISQSPFKFPSMYLAS